MLRKFEIFVKGKELVQSGNVGEKKAQEAATEAQQKMKSKKEKPPARIELATFRLRSERTTTMLRRLVDVIRSKNYLLRKKTVRDKINTNFPTYFL